MTPSRRMVVLGASNIARNRAAVINTIRQALGPDVDILLAMGHGRSYGHESRVLGRTLPGICQCRLWAELAHRQPLPTDALLTDVGNDLVYGRTPERIAGYVRQCARRLATVAERMVVTELPMESLRTLDRSRYALMRSILFPSSTLTFEEATASAEKLNEMVCEIAQDYGAELVRPPGAWYGFDPIHIRPWLVRKAWRNILSSLHADPSHDVDSLTIKERLGVITAVPYTRRVFGVRQQRRQPAMTLNEACHVSFF